MSKESINRSLIEELGAETNVFGESLCFSVVTGSTALGLATAESDLDVLTVVAPNESSPRAIIEFARKHVELQIKYGRKPDYDYPTDVISRAQLLDTVNGRAIVAPNGLLLEDDSINNPEFDYRVWLYEMITHDFQLLAGSSAELEQATMKALTVTMLTCAVRERCALINLDDLRLKIMKPSGDNRLLNNTQTEMLLGAIGSSNFSYFDRGIVEIDQISVREEVRNLLKLPRDAKHIVPWSELRKQ